MSPYYLATRSDNELTELLTFFEKNPNVIIEIKEEINRRKK